MQTLLRNCRLVPALSGGWDNGLADVLLNGETIADIFSAGSGIRADSELDCQGKTLMPGLFDLHMHINWAYHKGELRLDDFKIFIESCISAKLYLDNGVTTVRDLGSARRVSGAVRSAIAAGIFTGPRILCGPCPIRKAAKMQTAFSPLFIYRGLALSVQPLKELPALSQAFFLFVAGAFVF